MPLAEVRATANVLRAAGLECTGLMDEPTAANNVLQIRDGAIVDVGGGTTGVAVIQRRPSGATLPMKPPAARIFRWSSPGPRT